MLNAMCSWIYVPGSTNLSNISMQQCLYECKFCNKGRHSYANIFTYTEVHSYGLHKSVHSRFMPSRGVRDSYSWTVSIWQPRQACSQVCSSRPRSDWGIVEKNLEASKAEQTMLRLASFSEVYLPHNYFYCSYINVYMSVRCIDVMQICYCMLTYTSDSLSASHITLWKTMAWSYLL